MAGPVLHSDYELQAFSSILYKTLMTSSCVIELQSTCLDRNVTSATEIIHNIIQIHKVVHFLYEFFFTSSFTLN